MSDKRVEDQIFELVQRIYVSERPVYTAAQLNGHFQRAASVHRQDVTIQQVAHVIDLMATKSPGKEISASDLKVLASQFWSPSSSFDSVFKDLLQPTEQFSQIKQAQRMDYTGSGARDLTESKDAVTEVDIYDEASDIQTLVDPNLTYAQRDLPLFRYAATLVDEELRATNRINKCAIKLKYQTPELLVYQANFQTPAGEGEVFVPVELRDGSPLIPQVITTTEKVYNLDTAGIDALAQDLTYQLYKKQAQNAKRLRADLGTYNSTVRNDSMGTVEVDELDDLPQREAHLGVEEIEQVLKDAVFHSDSKYSHATIDHGRNLVAMELYDLGYPNSQVRFAGDWQHGLQYTATVNTEQGKLEIIVPVEDAKGVLLPPSTFAAEDGQSGYAIAELSKTSIQRFARVGDTRVDAHPLLYSMSYPELKKQLKRAAHQHDPKLAQTVIGLIDEKFGDYYKTASIDDYQTWLEEATASYQSRCGGCNYYTPKAAQQKQHQDHCNLIKTACKDVRKDTSGICTRSIFNEEDAPDNILFDTGMNIKL